ncbi:MAG: L-serine ammonia-lyase [Chlamydiales bacterium]|nr:L-serine ammonia-lyase [Chlamydiales bacterium]
MQVSIFDLFSIGVGPSSSHTVGPMRAAREFLMRLCSKNVLMQVDKLTIELFGSLAMTGIGHGTHKALLMGFMGETPEDIDPNVIDPQTEQIYKECKLHLSKEKWINFNPEKDLIFHKGKRLPFHSNAMRFIAKDTKGKVLDKEVYYSVGGGFINNQAELKRKENTVSADFVFPFLFYTYEELEKHCIKENATISEIVMRNELSLDVEKNIRKGILNIWEVMKNCVKRGVATEGILPGGLEVVRRAPGLLKDIKEAQKRKDKDIAEVLDWVSLYALAVNEENAGGGKVVTAPTNGAAGVIPAVLHYYEQFVPSYSEDGLIKFFLTASAIGTIYKFGASLSAAEMGCQGEVGVAASMAAAGLTAALGGSNSQVENAAEIAMEHHLGLTCDPIGGLVQIPCIERNTMGAIKAINASRLALKGKGEHKVRLDQVVKAMREIGEDMHSKYKETSVGGLATNVPVNIPEC